VVIVVTTVLLVMLMNVLPVKMDTDQTPLIMVVLPVPPIMLV
jgi:hypothetical protein